MRLVRLVRAHLDTFVALVLAAAFLVEVYRAERSVVGDPLLAEPAVDEAAAIAVAATFLLSLAARVRLPLLPLLLAVPTIVLAGHGQDVPLYAVPAGVVLAVYSVGAWAGGRVGQLGALGVGALIGLVVIRSFEGQFDPRAQAAPALLLLAAWLTGLAVRSYRAAQGDERVVGELDWEAGAAAPDSPGRDDTVRELRDVVERAMSAVILQARSARRTLDEDPRAAHRALIVVETAASDALEETQRLTGLLLSPDGTPLPEPQPGLADLDYLAEQVTAAGLPVTIRTEGRVLPLTPDLDGAAYRVVHEALMAALDGAAARRADVVVRYEPDELQIEVVDDGAGASEDPEAQTAGLIEARDQVVRLGGTLDAGPGEDRGYWVVARLPYEPDWF